MIICAKRKGCLRRQHGLTLVELMVSLVLSLVLMLGAMQLFTGSKRTYQLSESLSRVQENGRFALDLIVNDLRLAGYTGCRASPEFSNVLDITTPNPADDEWAYAFQRPLFAYDGGETASPVTFPTAAAGGVPGEAWVFGNADDQVPDSIVSLFADPGQSFVVIQSPSSADNPLLIPTTTEVEEGDYLIVTDCDRAALFRATGVAPDIAGTLIAHTEDAADGDAETPENCTARLHDACSAAGSEVDLSLLKPYIADVSRVALLMARGYYIGNTGRLDVGGNPVPALYRQSLTQSGLVRAEMVEGVSDLQLEYGIAGPGERSARSYLRADEIAGGDWERVVSVRVLITVRAPDDPDISRDFSATVAVRNRTL